MVNNSTSINKTSDYLLPQMIEQNKQKRLTYGVGNSGPGLGQAQKIGEGGIPSPLW